MNELSDSGMRVPLSLRARDVPFDQVVIPAASSPVVCTDEVDPACDLTQAFKDWWGASSTSSTYLVVPSASHNGLTYLNGAAAAWDVILRHLEAGEDLSAAVSAGNTFLNGSNVFVIIGKNAGVGVKIR